MKEGYVFTARNNLSTSTHIYIYNTPPDLDLPPLHLSKVGVNPLFLGSFVSTAHIYRYTSWMTAAIHVNLLYNKNEKI